MSVIAPKYLWRVLAVSAALVFAYATVLRKLGIDWWTDENYSHGLLIPFVIGFILWSTRERFKQTPASPSGWWGGAAVLCALFALWVGTAGAELYTQRMSLVLMVAGVVVYFWGFRILQLTLVPLALFVLAIPIPLIIFNKIAFPLQIFASRCAVWSMRLFDISVLRAGNVIELLPRGSLETKKLEVVEACSGIRSLMTLVTLSVVFAYMTHPRDSGPGPRAPWWKSYGFWRSAILVIAAVPIAILTNALRVSGTGVLAHYYGTGVADGFFHSFSGWVIYISAALLMFAVGWVLDRFQPKAHQSTGQQRAAVKENKTEEITVTSRAPAGSVIPAGESK
ncbi:MAG: exosortase [Acidobacteriota bacterium]|nr:exosortase [Acidobacteriota bacterium]